MKCSILVPDRPSADASAAIAALVSAATETQSAATMVVVEMQMTQSLPHIMLNYSVFSIRVCVSLSAACVESYEQIFYSLMFTTSSPHAKNVYTFKCFKINSLRLANKSGRI